MSNSNPIQSTNQKGTLSTAGNITPKEKMLSLGGYLKDLKADKEVNALLLESFSAAKVPTEFKSEVLKSVASNAFFIDLKNPATLNDAYTLVLFSMMLKPFGFELEDPASENATETAADNIQGYKSFLFGDGKITKQEYEDLKLSPKVQALIIKAVVDRNRGIQNLIQTAPRIQSNDLPSQSPGAAIKIVLKKIGYKGYTVTGVEEKDGQIIVDPSLSIEDINSIIMCFGRSRYKIQFAVPGIKEILSPTLNILIEGATADQQGALTAVREELDRDDKTDKNLGLTENDRAVLYKMLNDLYAAPVSDENNNKIYALETITGNMKWTPGLPAADIQKLQWLSENMGVGSIPALITIGTTKAGSNQPEFASALQIFNRIGCEIAAIADYAGEKSTGILGTLWNGAIGETSSAFRKNDDRRVVATGAPQGYISVLKYMLFKEDYVAELTELTSELFGKDGKSGLLKDFEAYQKLADKFVKLRNRADAIAKAANDRGFALPAEKDEYDNIIRQQQALINDNQQLMDFEKNGTVDVIKKLDRYYWLTGYLTSDEIDYNFLSRFKDKLPGLMDKEFPIKNAYNGAEVKTSVSDMIFKLNDKKPTFFQRFEEGEKWTTLNIIVGEGGNDENILLAKQVLAAAITSMNITQEKVDWLSPAVFIPGNLIRNPYISWPAMGAAILAPNLGPTTGAKTWEDLGNVNPQANVLNNIQMTSGTQGNLNYGLLWKLLLVQNSENPGASLVKLFGNDAVANKNRLDAFAMGELITLLTEFYKIAGKTILENPGAGQEIKNEKMNYRNFSAENNVVLRNLASIKDIMQRYDFSFDLQEDHLPVDLDKVKNNGDRQTIQAGADMLRKLLMDVYALMGIINKVEAQKLKTPPQEPVVEAMFGNNGISREFIISGQTGTLSRIYEAGDKGITFQSFIKGTGNYLWETPKTAIEFRTMMPYYNIPLGFLQAGKFGWTALQNSFTGNDEKADRAWENFKMTVGQTYGSFFAWEYMPLYIVKSGKDKLEHGNVAGGLAELTVVGVMAYHTFKRSFTLLANPIKWSLGLNSLPMDQYVNMQGMTLKLPIKGVNFILQKPVKYVANKIDPNHQHLLNQNWRYNHSLFGLTKYVNNKIVDPIGTKMTGIGGKIEISPSVKKTASFVFNDLLNAELLDKKIGDVAWNGIKGAYYFGRKKAAGIPSGNSQGTDFNLAQAYSEEFKAICRQHINNAVVAVIQDQARFGPLSGQLDELRSIARNSGIYDINAFETDLISGLFKGAYASVEGEIETELQDLAKKNGKNGLADGSLNRKLMKNNLLSSISLKYEKTFKAFGNHVQELETHIQELEDLKAGNADQDMINQGTKKVEQEAITVEQEANRIAEAVRMEIRSAINKSPIWQQWIGKIVKPISKVISAEIKAKTRDADLMGDAVEDAKANLNKNIGILNKIVETVKGSASTKEVEIKTADDGPTIKFDRLVLRKMLGKVLAGVKNSEDAFKKISSEMKGTQIEPESFKLVYDEMLGRIKKSQLKVLGKLLETKTIKLEPKKVETLPVENEVELAYADEIVPEVDINTNKNTSETNTDKTVSEADITPDENTSKTKTNKTVPETDINTDENTSKTKTVKTVPEADVNPVINTSGTKLPDNIYTVNNGDNLWSIAKKYKTTVDKLLELNPDIIDPKTIKPGQKLVIRFKSLGAAAAGFTEANALTAEEMISISESKAFEKILSDPELTSKVEKYFNSPEFRDMKITEADANVIKYLTEVKNGSFKIRAGIEAGNIIAGVLIILGADKVATVLGIDNKVAHFAFTMTAVTLGTMGTNAVLQKALSTAEMKTAARLLNAAMPNTASSLARFSSGVVNFVKGMGTMTFYSKVYSAAVAGSDNRILNSQITNLVVSLVAPKIVNYSIGAALKTVGAAVGTTGEIPILGEVVAVVGTIQLVSDLVTMFASSDYGMSVRNRGYYNSYKLEGGALYDFNHFVWGGALEWLQTSVLRPEYKVGVVLQDIQESNVLRETLMENLKAMVLAKQSLAFLSKKVEFDANEKEIYEYMEKCLQNDPEIVPGSWNHCLAVLMKYPKLSAKQFMDILDKSNLMQYQTAFAYLYTVQPSIFNGFESSTLNNDIRECFDKDGVLRSDKLDRYTQLVRLAIAADQKSAQLKIAGLKQMAADKSGGINIRSLKDHSILRKEVIDNIDAAVLRKAMEDCNYYGSIETLRNLSVYNAARFEEIISLALGRMFKEKVRFENAVMCVDNKFYAHEIYDIEAIDANIAGKLLKIQQKKTQSFNISTYQSFQNKKIEDQNRDYYAKAQKMEICANNLDRFSTQPYLSYEKKVILTDDKDQRNVEIIKEVQAAMVLLGYKVQVNGKFDNDTQVALKTFRTSALGGYDPSYDGKYIDGFLLRDIKYALLQESRTINNKIVNVGLYNMIWNK
jgi:LysM repeat protein